MKILSVVGARPQFVKASLVSGELARRGVEEILVHTGQHYDSRMSDVFFEQLRMPEPKYNLGVGSGLHGAQTGEMMRRLEEVVMSERPDWVVVYGDTNTTLAGGLVAAKLLVPLAHVESGLRSFNRTMPEEINRIVVDHVANLLLAPNLSAAEQLRSEGIKRGVVPVGDLMADHAQSVARKLPARPPALDAFDVTPRSYTVATIHRPSNTDDEEAFVRIVKGLRETNIKVIFPVHPRTRRLTEKYGVGQGDNIVVADPLPYHEMIGLVMHSAGVFTDSGGMQKESYVLGVPCITLRDETEWLETLENGWNVLTGSDDRKIVAAWNRPAPGARKRPFGDMRAAQNIVDALLETRAVCAA